MTYPVNKRRKERPCPTHQSLLAATGVMLSLSAPALYLIGLTFEAGYLNAYGLSATLVPNSTTGYITNSYFALVYVFGKNLFHSEFVAIALIAFAVAVLFLFAALRKIGNVIQSSRPGKEISKRISTTVQGSKVHTDLPVVIPILFTALLYCAVVLLLLVPLYFYAQGTKYGNEQRVSLEEDIQKPGHQVPSQILEDGKSIIQGKIIHKTDTEIAIFDGTQTILIVVKPNLRIIQQAPTTPTSTHDQKDHAKNDKQTNMTRPLSSPRSENYQTE